jgi:hypothetical protein
MNKPLIYLLILILHSCVNKHGRNSLQNHISMEQETLQLKVGETKSIGLPNRGASGLRLVFSIDNPGIVEVNQKEIKSMEDIDTSQMKPGDPFPAFFYIKAIAKGDAKINFSERPAGANSTRDMHLKTYSVSVHE